jgi:solute carrier family 25 protein 38
MVSSIVKEEGIRPLYRGYGITLVRDVPWAALQFSLYMKFLEIIPVIFLNKENGPSSMGISLSASLSGALATLITHPADVIKTRLQLQRGSLALARYRHSPDVVVKIWREEGFKTFFRGVVPRLVHRSILPAITWPVFERVSRYLQQQ